MRRNIYKLIDDSTIYNWFMITIIVISIIPLAFKDTNELFIYTDRITVTIFIMDYIVRWYTSDLKLNKGLKSFILYIFTPLAVIDLLSILPSLTIMSDELRLLKIFRLFRSFKVMKAFKLIRYSKNVSLIIRVFKKQSSLLLAVCSLAAAYIVISALVIFNIEPDTFNTFFDALYWATVSLTTMGYGDIYPITNIGRAITMISSILGIAILALPASIITVGYMDEVDKTNKDWKDSFRKSLFFIYT